MRYLVMECNLSYAIVMDNQGRFCRVPNLGYTVGQQLDEVLLLSPRKPKWRRAAVIAALLCLLVLGLGGGQLWFVPYGTVEMEINPDLLLTVNRLDRVIQIEGRNDDGNTLLAGYNPHGGRVEEVAKQLADRATGLGYLDEGGVITLTVTSDQDSWRAATQNQLILELTDHLNHQVTITVPGREVRAPETESSGDADKQKTPPATPPQDNDDDDETDDHHPETHHTEWDDEDSLDD